MRSLLLKVAQPFQPLLDSPSPTHSFINLQAITILKNDGKPAEGELLERYFREFDEGCLWADTGWKNVGHSYDPRTGLGFKGWPSAVQMVTEYWNDAVRHCAGNRMSEAFYYLGAASHLVQDLCVPHHAANKLFSGHKRFEQYAQIHRHRYAVNRNGLYDEACTPAGWVVVNAVYTRERYSHCINKGLDTKLIDQAIADLLPRAQRTTAGFVSYSLNQMGVVWGESAGSTDVGPLWQWPSVGGEGRRPGLPGIVAHGLR